MTYLDDPDLDALLAEIDGMSDEELDQLAAEMEAGDAGWPGDDDYDLEGPWRDLANATAQMDAMYQRNAQRLAGRAAGGTGRLKDEDRLASAMQAIGQGTYTEPPQLRTGPEAVRDRLGLAQDACGPLDDFGRCSARYHDRDCHVVIEGSAATSDAEAASAWRDVLAGYTPSPDAFGAAEALGLATPAGPDPLSGAGDAWSYLLQPEGGSLAEAELRAAVLADMGEAGAPLPEPAWPRRDVAWARAALGL